MMMMRRGGGSVKSPFLYLTDFGNPCSVLFDICPALGSQRSRNSAGSQDAQRRQKRYKVPPGFELFEMSTPPPFIDFVPSKSGLQFLTV